MESTTTELRKGWNLSWYHHLTHIACVQKLRGLRQKLDALRVQTGPSLFKVRGFQTKTHLFQMHFIFMNLFQLNTFCAFNMHDSKPHTKISTLLDFICYFFMHLMIYFELNNPPIGKHYNWTQKRLKLGMWCLHTLLFL